LINYNKDRLKKDLFSDNKEGEKIIFYHAVSPEAEGR
jgi:hypothetical protein